jgi:hypothetical protein
MPTTQDDTLRRLLTAWDDADALAELEPLTRPAENARRRTREERAAERAARADWEAENAHLDRAERQLTLT